MTFLQTVTGFIPARGCSVGAAVSKHKGCSLHFRALSSSSCASGVRTAVIWLLHSSGVVALRLGRLSRSS